MNKILKVKFVDSTYDSIRSMTLPILKKNFDIVQECDEPDFIFYSVFGHEHLKYNCVRIFWTGENIQPDFNVCDYAIGFSHMQYEDRYCRIPLYYFYTQDYQRAVKKHLLTSEEISVKKRFCNFVYSNGNADSEREHFFDLLSQYKKVDSGGKFRNNMDGKLVEDKYEFQKQYKFSIAFENSSTSGYTTEKILQAFAAGTIPIYWGNPKIAEDFNAKAFINCHDYGSYDEIINKIKEIDLNDNLYKQYILEPIGSIEKFPENPLKEYENYITYICRQEKMKAYRRSNVFLGKYYQEELKNAFATKMSVSSLKHQVAKKLKEFW